MSAVGRFGPMQLVGPVPSSDTHAHNGIGEDMDVIVNLLYTVAANLYAGISAGSTEPATPPTTQVTPE